MKANEAPEKIHIVIDRSWGGMVVNYDRNDPENIEYTRTDAFIEKACSWLRTHSESDYFELIPDANYCGVGNLNKKRMIDEFRKYMKGE